MPKVIVIGQGAAGLTAALSLAKEGIEVVSLSKARPGNATCTIYAGAGLTMPIDGMPIEEHKRMTYDVGRHHQRPRFAGCLFCDSPTVAPFHRSAGVPFTTRRGSLGITKDPAFPLLGASRSPTLWQRAALRAASHLFTISPPSGSFSETGVLMESNASITINGTVATLEADAVLLATAAEARFTSGLTIPKR